MFRKTWNSPHFLARTASHSTKGSRNGRVDVLPPEAKIDLYDIALQINDTQACIDLLTTQLDTARRSLHSLVRIDALRNKHGSAASEASDRRSASDQIDSMNLQLKQQRRRLGELKFLIAGAGPITFDGIFARLARAELPDDLYRLLEFKVHGILERAKQ